MDKSTRSYTWEGGTELGNISIPSHPTRRPQSHWPPSPGRGVPKPSNRNEMYSKATPAASPTPSPGALPPASARCHWLPDPSVVPQ